MLDLTNHSLRTRDIRKIVEQSAINIQWDEGFDTDNEWVHLDDVKTQTWVHSKKIDSSELLFCTDPSWSHTAIESWYQVTSNLDELLDKGFSKFISRHRLWLLEVHPIKVARFGYWR